MVETPDILDLYEPIACDKGSAKPEFDRRFVLQTVSDAIAFAEDVSIRILDLEKLLQFETIARNASRAKHMQALWEGHLERHPNLKKKFKGRSLSSAYDMYFPDRYPLSTFIAQFVENTVAGFEVICTHIDECIARLDSSLNTIEEISGPLEKSILEKDFGVYNFSRKTKRIGKFNAKIELLSFLMSEVATQIWQTNNSNARPFHGFLRMGRFWRLHVFCWIIVTYTKQAKEAEADPEILNRTLHDAQGIPGCLLVHTRRLDAKRLAVFGPFYDPAKSGRSTELLTGEIYKNNGVYLSFCHYFFTRAIEKPQGLYAGIDEMRPVLTRASDDTETRVTNAVNISLRALNDFAQIYQKQKAEIAELEADSLARAGYLSAFLIRLNEGRLLVTDDVKQAVRDILIETVQASNTSPHLLRLQLKIKDRPDGEKGFTFGIKLNRHDPAISVEDDDAQLSQTDQDARSLWAFYRRAARDRFRSFAEFRLISLKESLQRQARLANGWEDAMGPTIYQIQRLMRADLSATLFRVQYGDTAWGRPKLVIIDTFADDPRIRATLPLFRQSIDSDEVRQKRGDVSLAYAALDEDSYKYVKNIPDGIAQSDYCDNAVGFRPGSAVLLPIRKDNRVVGLIKLKGSQSGHFIALLREILPAAGAMLSEFMYERIVIQSLRQLSGNALSVEQFNSKDPVNAPQNPYHNSATALCNIFLSEEAHIYLRRDPKADRFTLVGASDPTAEQKLGRDVLYGAFADIDLNNIETTSKTALIEYFPAALSHFDEKPKFLELTFDDALEFSWSDEREWRASVPLSWMTSRTRFNEIRQYLCGPDGKGYRDVLMFPIYDEDTKGTSDGKIISFVLLFNRQKVRFNRGWEDHVGLIEDDMAIALRFGGILRDAAHFDYDLFAHQLQELVNAIDRRVKGTIDRFGYLTRKVSDFASSYRGARDAIERNIERTFARIGGKYRVEAMVELDEVFGKRFGDKDYANSEISKMSTTIDSMNKDRRQIYDILKRAGDKVRSISKNRSEIRNEYNVVDVSVIEEIVSINSTQKKFFEENGIVFQYDLTKADDQLTWKMDRIVFESIFNNMVENMLKYSVKNTVSEIIVEEDMVIFENSGKHDPTVNDVSIFLKGFRGKLALSDENRKTGSGHGLYYARQLAHASGFDIEFVQKEPTGPDKISLYRFVVSAL